MQLLAVLGLVILGMLLGIAATIHVLNPKTATVPAQNANQGVRTVTEREAEVLMAGGEGL